VVVKAAPSPSREFTIVETPTEVTKAMCQCLCGHVETPAVIAAERKSLQKILENALSKVDEVEKRMAAYTSR